MTILEAYELAKAGKTVISPDGIFMSPDFFHKVQAFNAAEVFGEWRVKREQVVFEADVGHLSMSDCVVMYCESLRHLIGKRVKVSVEVIDD